MKFEKDEAAILLDKIRRVFDESEQWDSYTLDVIRAMVGKFPQGERGVRYVTAMRPLEKVGAGEKPSASDGMAKAAEPRIVPCLMLIDSMRSRRFPEPGRYRAKIYSRKGYVDLYVSRPCDKREDAIRLGLKYAAKNPQYKVDNLADIEERLREMKK